MREDLPKLQTRYDQAQDIPITLQKTWGPPGTFEFNSGVLELYKKCNQSGIPFAYLDLEWEDFQNSDRFALGKVQAFVQNIGFYWRTGGGLLLHGPNGTGKSFLSYQVARAAVALNIPTICLSLIEYVEKKRLQRVQPNLILELMRSIERAKVTVIDDFGKEYGEGANWQSYEAYTALFNIFREGPNRVVVLNTALFPKDIDKKAGTSIMSRMGSYTNIPVSGEDFRDLVLEPETFNLMRSAEKQHKHCWEPHPLLAKTTVQKVTQTLGSSDCKCCKYRFHPKLCTLRFERKWINGTGTAGVGGAQASGSD